MVTMKTRAPILEVVLLLYLWAVILCLLPAYGDESTSSPRPSPLDPKGRQTITAPSDSNVSVSPVRATPKRPRPIDEARARREGIRKLTGKHLTLFTDLPSEPEIDRLPAIFDAAVPQWCAYFKISQTVVADWQVRGYLMGDRTRFLETELIPRGFPMFPNGFAEACDLWLVEQPTAYYRRHLLLHEGTHCFMLSWLDGGGPPWYMEGVAELLATHADADGVLRLGHFPRDRSEVPMLGRIKRIQDYVAAQPALGIDEILSFGPRAHWNNPDAYAWCWAACALLDRHPRYQRPFRQLRHHVRSDRFNQQFASLFAELAEPLKVEWQLFASSLVHGHDVEATAMDFRTGEALPDAWQQRRIVATRGWQNSGWWLEAGETYEIRARGRFQIAREDPLADKRRQQGGQSAPPVVWWSEPNGVTIQYFGGHPLGMLLAAVVPGAPRANGKRNDDQPTAISLGNLLNAERVGTSRRWTPQESGTLHLRLNDSPGKLGDNRGGVDVAIRAI